MSNHSYVRYRLPGSDSVVTVRGRLYDHASAEDIDTVRGFVIAPFAEDGTAMGRVMLHADSMETEKLSELIPSGDVQADFKVDILDDYRQNYHHDFLRFHALLLTGELQKIVLARCLDIRLSGALPPDEDKLFLRACRLYPSQMVVMACIPSGVWLMATPELLLDAAGETAGNSLPWHTMALAGTRHGSMTWTEKEHSEQELVQRYVEERLRPLAGKIEKSSTAEAQAASLRHIRTDFTFSPSAGVCPSDVVAALHPTPAVCGLPAHKAFREITEHESIDRQYYSGYCGPCNIGGRTQLYVSLRCMRMTARHCTLYAGGGLLAGSNEESEWLETEAKMQTMLRVLRGY